MNTKRIVDIKIRCPTCGGHGVLQVEEYPFKNSPRGITSINLSEGFICPHSLVAYVDRNLALRDIFTADFKIKIPTVAFEDIDKEKKINFDVDIVKINLLPTLLINILRGIFFGKRMVILFEEEFIGKTILEFLKYITQESFKLEIQTFSRQYYRKNKTSYKDWIVLDKDQILYDKNKTIDPKQSKIESIIVQKFYSEMDAKSSLIIIKNELYKSFRLTKGIEELARDNEEKGRLNSKVILNFLKDRFKIDLDLVYLKFLMNILEMYFGVKIKMVSESADFLELL
ncbi:MAG: hypothetical protein ACFFBP_21045 [Promethearchaeota archaeon]